MPFSPCIGDETFVFLKKVSPLQAKIACVAEAYVRFVYYLDVD